MKIPVVINAQWNEWEKEFGFCAFARDMSSCGYIPCFETEVEFEPPSHADLVAGTVKVIKAEQDKVRAKAQNEITDLQRQIDELLCIEHRPDEAEPGLAARSLEPAP